MAPNKPTQHRVEPAGFDALARHENDAENDVNFFSKIKKPCRGGLKPARMARAGSSACWITQGRLPTTNQSRSRLGQAPSGLVGHCASRGLLDAAVWPSYQLIGHMLLFFALNRQYNCVNSMGEYCMVI